VADVEGKNLRRMVFGTGEILHAGFCMKKIANDRRSGDDRRTSTRRIAKGRRIGEEHPNAILTDGEVELMRHLREVDGLTYDALAAKFEVSKSSVAKICKYQRR
jgi:ribosome-binding protein aMBF1 (putative translation factor)